MMDDLSQALRKVFETPCRVWPYAILSADVQMNNSSPDHRAIGTQALHSSVYDKT